MATIAKGKGWKLSKNGLFDEYEALIPCDSEQAIFEALEMEFVFPRNR